jgi:hypothetical protein
MPKINRPNAQDLLCMAREALLDIKVRRQSRICFANALRTTRSTFACLAKRWIGFFEDDAFSRLAKSMSISPKTM